MGRISTNLTDLSIFTAEDPRTENILKILNQMKRGAVNKNIYLFQNEGKLFHMPYLLLKTVILLVFLEKDMRKVCVLKIMNILGVIMIFYNESN